MFALNGGDFVKGLVTAVLGGVIISVGGVLHGVFLAPGFDVFAVDWTLVLHNTINAAVIGAMGSFGGYITKNFFSNDEGKVLGKIG